MKSSHIRLASDLHLEAFAQRDLDVLINIFLPLDERDANSILVLAGDISSIPDQLIGFIKRCTERFLHVVFVPGNHETYRHDYHKWNSKISARFAAEVPTLHYACGKVETKIIDDIRFIYGTLWADGGPTQADQLQVNFYLNDFRVISNGDKRFSIQDMMEINKDQAKQIEQYLQQPTDHKTVVVTHHLPSRRLVSTRFWPTDGSDGANGGFASNCDNMIAVHEPALWIHGHTHDRISTTLWKTRIECNPAGYRGEYSTEFNTFMRSELKDGNYVLVAVPVFVKISEL